MSGIFLIAFAFFNGVLVFYLIFPFLNTLAGFFLREKKKGIHQAAPTDFAIIITSYKDEGITVPLIHSILQQDYPLFHIYLVADRSEKSGNFPVESASLTVLFPEHPLDSKVKSIVLAMGSYIRVHNYTLIFDPDNLAAPGLLAELHSYVAAGYRAVQGRRAAKNLDSRFACLDALGEHYYNHTQRSVPFLLGSSAPIAGSGMAIETTLYRSILEEIEEENASVKVIVAEDKMLQHKIVRRGLRIAYAGNAIVFDEKIAGGRQMERQRTRWLNSYFKHFLESVSLMAGGLATINFNRFYFGLVVSTPPMIIMLLGSAVCILLGVFIFPLLSVLTVIAGFLFTLNFLLVLRAVHAEPEIWKALWGLPSFILGQIMALTRMRRADSDFMVTKKEKTVSIEDVLRNRDGKAGDEK